MQTQPQTAIIYKICPRNAWHEARVTGQYEGSADDLRDGFIHLSTADQLRGTLDKHFADQPALLLIGVNAANLGPALKWEPSRGGQLFPHLFAPLPVSAALWTQPIKLDDEGSHVIPNLSPGNADPAGES